jgi:hypothetical protein
MAGSSELQVTARLSWQSPRRDPDPMPGRQHDIGTGDHAGPRETDGSGPELTKRVRKGPVQLDSSRPGWRTERLNPASGA